MRKLDIKLSRVEYARLRPVVVAILDHVHEREVWSERLSRCKSGRASLDPLAWVIHRGEATGQHYFRELVEWALDALPKVPQEKYLTGLYLLVWKSLESGVPGAGISGMFDVDAGTLEIQSKEHAMTAAYNGSGREFAVQSTIADIYGQAAKLIVTDEHEEETMSTALEAVKIEEVTRVNGRDVAEISDGALLDLIQQEKAKIEKLSDMRIGSKRIVGIIDELKASVAELTAIFDSRE